MRRYNRDERRYDRDEPRGADPETSRRRRFPWDDPAANPGATSDRATHGREPSPDPAPEWTEPPTDPDFQSSQTLEEFRAEPVPDEVRAGEPDTSEASEEFPWQESAGTDQPSPVWEDQPADTPMSAGRPGSAATVRHTNRNRMAIAGFVCSLVMWIPFPSRLNFVLWVMALTFSSIGLRRSRKRGLPQKGLAIAGLCLSLIGVVAIIVLAILFSIG